MAYLNKFESHAKAHDMDVDKWSEYLSWNLKGEALTFYNTMTSGEDKYIKYDEFKKALLNKYASTQEGYRIKFRNTKPNPDNTFGEFAKTIEGYLDQWVEMSNVEKSFEGMKELLMCEQIMDSVPRELKISLKERDIKTKKDLIVAAESYRTARTESKPDKKSGFAVGSVGSDYTPAKPYINSRGRDRGFGRGRGFEPNQFGFPETQGTRQSYNSYRMPRNRGRGFQSRGFQSNNSQAFRSNNTEAQHTLNQDRVQCFACNGVGHYKAECPTYLKKSGFQNKSAAVSVALPESLHEVMCSAVVQGSLPICEGKVNGIQVSVLRDSGATTAGIREALVRPKQYVGRTQKVISFGGNVEEFELALVNVETSFFEGPLLCCVIKDPIADLILGNVDGVKPIPGLIMNDSPQVAAAVETRAQRGEKEKTIMHTPLTNLSLTTEELISFQEQDPALQRYREMAVTEECINEGKSSFIL
eukprot:TRINITY_DN15246_c0_g1_i12.p1 TRINITY_DN15246_c0_g1~~TRINITY_DN15246_c0_g1_i12.p1  ORF type:complete len:473 (+),score=52.37 TRINITY_DN15246_c0_g1_i12:280-1698(+)